MTMDIGLEFMYYEIPIHYGYDLKVKDTGGDVPLMSMTETMSVLDESMELEIYAEDDKWAYAVRDGEGYALRLDGEDDITDESEVVTGMVVAAYPADFLEYARVYKGATSTKFVLEFTKEELYEYFPTVFASVNEICGVDDVNELAITDASMEIVIENNDLSRQLLKYNMEFTAGGIYSTAEVEIEVNYPKFDDEVEITAPDGYIYFPEFHGSLI